MKTITINIENQGPRNRVNYTVTAESDTGTEYINPEVGIHPRPKAIGFGMFVLTNIKVDNQDANFVVIIDGETVPSAAVEALRYWL